MLAASAQLSAATVLLIAISSAQIGLNFCFLGIGPVQAACLRWHRVGYEACPVRCTELAGNLVRRGITESAVTFSAISWPGTGGRAAEFGSLPRLWDPCLLGANGVPDQA
jgi:hypothetical protein